MKKRKNILVFLLIMCILSAIALHIGSRIFISQLDFTAWCQNISVKSLDYAYINVRCPDNSYQSIELTKEEKDRLVCILNSLQLSDIKLMQIAHDYPNQILYGEGQGIRFTLESYPDCPKFVRVLGDYQHNRDQLYNNLARYIWVENEDLMSFLHGLLHN